MRIESNLCHISENKAVVKVNGWLNQQNVGSALAEASTVELAEDKAISRLNKRLNIINNENNESNNDELKAKGKIKIELPKSENLVTDNKNKEPSDWSNELTAIDSEIKRLNWSRDDERKFLESNLGYNNRNKITKYDELLNYLSILKKTDNLDLNKSNIINKDSMIEESDIILRDLSWNNKQGREYLEKEFNVSTRKELSENQLKLFVDKLKLIRNQYLSQ